MSSLPPSIFNDVLGPVMRGPSSSHSAASVRIARLARDLVGGRVDKALIEFDPNGSLATTHESQGSDMGLFGGLLGWEADDPRLLDYENELAAAGIVLTTNYESYGATHPNMYLLKLRGEGGDEHSITAVSLGGGMIEVWKLDDTEVRLSGGSYVLFDAETGKVIEDAVKTATTLGIFFTSNSENTISQRNPGQSIVAKKRKYVKTSPNDFPAIAFTTILSSMGMRPDST